MRRRRRRRLSRRARLRVSAARRAPSMRRADAAERGRGDGGARIDRRRAAPGGLGASVRPAVAAGLFGVARRVTGGAVCGWRGRDGGPLPYRPRGAAVSRGGVVHEHDSPLSRRAHPGGSVDRGAAAPRSDRECFVRTSRRRRGWIGCIPRGGRRGAAAAGSGACAHRGAAAAATPLDRPHVTRRRFASSSPARTPGRAARRPWSSSTSDCAS